MNKSFDCIPNSTLTVIAITNWKFNINKLFDEIPITEYTVPKKTRGKKIEDLQLPPEGSIISVGMHDKIRGARQKKAKKFFRNSVTVVMSVQSKLINFKVSDSGKVQITGCKSVDQAKKTMMLLWEHTSAIGCILKPIDEIASVIFNVVMTNVDFDLGFLVNREALDEYINNNTPYYSLLETCFGYTGVNIKMPIEKYSHIELDKIYLDGLNWPTTKIRMEDYLETLSEKEKLKERKKTRYNTFLVFQSGSAIFSSMNRDIMEIYYGKFMDIIQKSKHLIVEKI